MWFEQIETAKGIRYRYSERFTTANGAVIKVSQTFPRKATKRTERAYYDALYKRFLKRQEKQRAINPASSVKTFYDLLDTWCALAARNVKSGTHKTHVTYVGKIKSLCADVPLSALSPRMIQRAMDTMYYEEKRSCGYTKIVLCFIKQAVRYAHKEHIMGDIDGFLQLRVQKDREREAAKEIAAEQNKFLNHNELVEVLRQLRGYNNKIALAMEFIALTGLRIGELQALRSMDYNRDKHTININGSIIFCKKNGEAGQRGTPKTPYSYRDVLLNDRAMWILDTMIATHRAYLWGKGIKTDPRPPEKQYIFCTSNGYPVGTRYINYVLRKVVLPGKHITTHIFRHTHISMLAERGVPLKAIMRRVGHHDPQTTLKIYTHVTNEMKERERRIITTLSV